MGANSRSYTGGGLAFAVVDLTKKHIADQRWFITIRSQNR
jgi:hypothetical protein